MSYLTYIGKGRWEGDLYALAFTSLQLRPPIGGTGTSVKKPTLVICREPTVKSGTGLTIVELVIVVAIAGVILAVGLVLFPRDGFALSQAAEGLVSDTKLARFEAISRASYVRLAIEPNENRYRLLEVEWDAANSTWVTNNVIKAVRLGDSRTERIAISTDDDNDLMFDPRGNPIGLGVQTVQFLAVSGRSANVTISQQGRASR